VAPEEACSSSSHMLMLIGWQGRNMTGTLFSTGRH
jgi:hypothetical protein